MVSFKSFLAVAALSAAVSALPQPAHLRARTSHEVEGSEPLASGSSGSSVDTASSTISSTEATSAVASSSESLATETLAASSVPSVSAPAYAPASTPDTLPKYGSGSSSWAEYDDCVAQCIEQFGPADEHVPPPKISGTPNESGKTHMVLVAPAPGVKRISPFAIYANVGDTVQFEWRADGHTITKGSALNMCAEAPDGFSTGKQNATFVHTEKVNSTEPVFVFCDVGTHCEDGMWAIINPPTDPASDTSVGALLDQMKEQDPDLALADAYARSKTAGNTAAESWGSNINLETVPEKYRSAALQNVMYTRAMIAMNEGSLQDDGNVDISNRASDVVLPKFDTVVNNAVASDPQSTASASASASSGTESAAPANQVSPSNSASVATTPRFLLAVTVAVATWFAF
jgi:plastocyanin